MPRAYKLTDKNGRTHGNTKWAAGVTHSGTGKGDLCGPGWIHAYEDKYVASLMNPLHAGFTNPQCWIAEGSGKVKRDGQLKTGYQTLTTVRRIKLPEYTTNQRVAFAIYCAQGVIGDTCPEWSKWADDWLSGKDRSAAAARAEAAAAAAAAALAAVRAEAARAEAHRNLPALARKAYKFERAG